MMSKSIFLREISIVHNYKFDENGHFERLMIGTVEQFR